MSFQLSFVNVHEGTPVQEPIDTFSVEEFRVRHGDGATIEMRNELITIKGYNESRRLLAAWVICPLVVSGPFRAAREEWLVFVRPPSGGDTRFSKVGDRCALAIDETLDLADKRVGSGFVPAERVDNPMEGIAPTAYSGYAAFKVFPTIGEGSNAKAPEVLKACSIAEGLSKLTPEFLKDFNSVKVILRLELNLTSYLAEMSALYQLTGDKREGADREPSPSSIEAFKWMLDFTKSPDATLDLFSILPHMKRPATSSIPTKLVKMFNALNPDARAAYEGLSSIPARLHMVAGCPGAGKTHWNLLVAAIALSQPFRDTMSSGDTRRRRAKILYLIDVNKPVDDSADRMHNLCNEVGLKRTIIRMHGWPYEMRQSTFINGDSGDSLNMALDEADSAQTRGPDFSRRFVTIAQIYREEGALPGVDPKKAPTLDEAAWDHFYKHKNDKYPELAVSLEKLLEEGVQSPREALSLRRCVYKLYSDVLKTADFVATTPVAAYGNFPKMYHPDVVFLDEAPHARELTSLIPIAFFSPKVWIYTGDFRQTRPFVAGLANNAREDSELIRNPFFKQLTISTMERADRVGALRNHLYINHRSYGGLEVLPSELFYAGRMRTGIPADEQYPKSLQHLRDFLEGFAGDAQQG